MIPNLNYGRDYFEKKAKDSSSCVPDKFPHY